jgi:uncharacterized protein YraI
MGSGAMTHVQSFMKIITGVQAILRYCLGNFKVCNVILMGEIYGVHRSNGLSLHNTHAKFHDDRLMYVSSIMVITATI